MIRFSLLALALGLAVLSVFLSWSARTPDSDLALSLAVMLAIVANLISWETK